MNERLFDEIDRFLKGEEFPIKRQPSRLRSEFLELAREPRVYFLATLALLFSFATYSEYVTPLEVKAQRAAAVRLEKEVEKACFRPITLEKVESCEQALKRIRVEKFHQILDSINNSS